MSNLSFNLVFIFQLSAVQKRKKGKFKFQFNSTVPESHSVLVSDDDRNDVSSRPVIHVIK